MLNLTLAVIYLLFAVGLAVFLLFRLNVHGAREAGGRGMIYGGLILIVATTTTATNSGKKVYRFTNTSSRLLE